MDTIYFIEYDNFEESCVCYEYGFFDSLYDAEHFVDTLGEDYYVRKLSIHEEE